MAGPLPMAPPPYAPGPYVHAFAITPGTAFPNGAITRAIYMGTAGNVTVTFAGDTTPVTLNGLLVGWWYEYAISACSAGPSNMVGLY